MSPLAFNFKPRHRDQTMVDSRVVHLGVVAATQRSSRWLHGDTGSRCSATPQVRESVDKSFCSGVLIGDYPGTLSVRDQILLDLHGFALELRGLVAHLPHFFFVLRRRVERSGCHGETKKSQSAMG